MGLSVAQASQLAGVAHSTWERVEQGSPTTTITTLCAATDAIGLDLVIRAHPGKGAPLRDRGQMAIAEYLAGVAHPAWKVGLEITAGEFGQAIDEVFWGADEILAVEIIRHMADYQGQYRSVSLKRDWLASRHGRPVRLVLAVEDLRSNRAAVSPHMGLISSVLPAGSRRVMDALRTGRPLGSDGLVWVRRPTGRDPRCIG